MARAWYVVQTYSQHEKKVEGLVLSRLGEDIFKDVVFDVKVPTEKITENKNGVKKVSEKRILPGYILIEMDMSAIGWQDVMGALRRIPGLSGFVGVSHRDQKPVPLSAEEFKSILIQSGEIKNNTSSNIYRNFAKGEVISVIKGSFQGFEGSILEVDNERQIVHVEVQILGRVTPVEVSFTDIEKL